jgi:hypothetical protein
MNRYTSIFPDRPPVDPYLDSVLRDWGRWARTGGRPPGTCASAEKRYVPEAGEVWETEPRPIPVDVRQAWEVETAWRTFVPIRERLLLRAHYVTAPTRSGDAWAAHVRRNSRAVGIRPSEWGAAVGTSARILGTYVMRWR